MDALLNKIGLILTFVLQVFIFVLLLKKGLQRRFFWFLIYIAYEVIESIVRLSVSSNLSLYRTVYWWTEIGDVTLMVLAFRESFVATFREYIRLRIFAAVVWSAIGAALLYAVFKALIFPPAQASRRAAIIIGLEVAINFTLCVLGVLFISLASLFKIKARRWERGIISGFSIYVTLAVFGFMIRSIFGTKFSLLNEWLSPVGYLLAEATWALELGRPEFKPPVPKRDLSVDDLTKVEQYSRILERFLGRKA